MNVLNLHSSLHTNSHFTSLFFSLLDLTGLSSSGYGERMRSYRFSDCVLMSVSSSDCSNDMDLLCGEDSGVFSGESTVDFSSSEVDSWPDDSIACFIEDERHFVPGHDYLSRFQTQSLDASAREESVAWILKVQEYYNFQPLTAYLAVNYMDRFLYARRLPETSGWPMQLLAVACLSLAAKMEEILVPSLFDFQVAGVKYLFEAKTIKRMELLVLSVLDWRLRSVTPFDFLSFFAYKIDPSGTFLGFFISHATEIILSNIKEASFLEYWPSSIAAAAILCVANELPSLSSVVNPHESPETWCDGLSKEKIVRCYRLMKAMAIENNRLNTPKVIAKLRVSVRAASTLTRPSDESSFSSSSPCKRRKLSGYSWVGDEKSTSS
ncbi:Cyclin C-terminal domain [Arabidopsis thaliana x Arabidopsis arenosa]|uniref:Cyclin C-terminal domain n=1 Tax=Arabidopsis thaliana x Arabidopsis arenosa TaxID=1240361 RepID=A0A8T2BLY6_9BRAS|nr:Cyclin C-terminal domain [Arabidopsis thaliana x Arabidopsis arenosa]